MKLYDHQKRIIEDDPVRAGLFLGTGSGKTRTALLLARGSTLVIAPKTQVEDGNWTREAALLHKETGLSIPLDVISKEYFRKWSVDLKAYNTVIVDETHTCLGVTPNVRQRHHVTIPKTSQLYEALDAYLRRTKPERLYLCTATIMKSPLTVWAALRLLRPKSQTDTFRSFLAFREKYYVKLPMPGRDVWVPKKDKKLKADLAKLVRELGYVGRLEDFFDVPSQTFITKHIELTGEQQARLKTISLDFPEPIVQIGKRHQIENGVLAGDEYNEGETFSNGKIDKIHELALEFPRMVIFAKYRAQIEQIRLSLKALGYSVFTLTGDTKDRGSVILGANNAKEGILVCQAQISAGWELPEYPVMVFASRTYSWVDYDQAIGRIQRANNIKKNLYINLVVKGGVDEAVDKSLANKQDFNEAIYANVLPTRHNS